MQFIPRYFNGYPYKHLLEEESVGLHPSPQEGRHLRSRLAFRCYQIEVVVVGFLLVDETVLVKCLQLIAHHKALKVRIPDFLPRLLHYMTTEVRSRRMVMNLEVWCSPSKVRNFY